MNRRVAAWLVATAALALALGGTLLGLWFRGGGWAFPLLAGVGVAGMVGYGVRLGGLVRRAAMVESVALVALAPLLPRREGVNWLAELGGQLHEVAGDPARWRAIRLDAVRSMPRLLSTAWGGWARDGVVTAAVRYARPRVAAIDQVMRSPLPPWPADGRASGRMRRRLRVLGWCSRVLVWSAGHRQQSDLISNARRLAGLCAQAHREITGTAYQRQPTARAAGLLLEIEQLTMMLAVGLARYRRASDG